MNKKYTAGRRLIAISGLAVATALFTGCEKFVELGAPPTQVEARLAFQSDASAQSAVLGLYANNNGLHGLVSYYSLYPGMSADDVQYNTPDATIDEFENNALTTQNSAIANNFWGNSYSLIKNANNAIYGLTNSGTLTPGVKNQLLGESKFIRAFVYFHLVQLFNKVPMPLGPDTEAIDKNAALGQSTPEEVYNQIEADLKDAKSMLPVAYTGTFRGRVNRDAATTLLARVYLTRKKYQEALASATEVIESSNKYTLPAPGIAFVNTSNEIILQIANQTGVSVFGSNYLATGTQAPKYSLDKSTYDAFEENDLRKKEWTGIKSVAGTEYYFVNKYKVASGTGNEYNVTLRFAELYLIRAEALSNLNQNLDLAVADINQIRGRAGLPLLATPSALSSAQLLQIIERERRSEFFGEWGHRWFDLKRTGRADAVLAPQKASWNSTDIFYPIPLAQIEQNTKLEQNEGYTN